MQSSPSWTSASGTPAHLQYTTGCSNIQSSCPIMPCFVHRCDKERECRAFLEEKLRKMFLLEEELKAFVLPGLENQLKNHTQHLMELQVQHQQVKP